MKKIYRKLIIFLENIILKFHILKTYFSEWIAILKKRKLYKNIKWSKSQKKEFNLYWKENYGKKISPRWHKLYEGINGRYQVDYIPDIIFSTKIESRFNKYFYSKIYSDKSLQAVIFSSNVKIPKTYLVNSYGTLVDSKNKVISFKEALILLENIGDVVIKPTVGTSSGRGVNILSILNGNDVISGKNIVEVLDIYKENFIIQERMIQHESLSILNPSSINTIRIITYIFDGKIYSCNPVLRIGSGDSHLDNLHAGGIAVGITKEGVLKKVGYQLGWLDSSKKYYSHPKTNIIFDGHKLFNFNNCLNLVKKLHGLTPQIKVVSWDLMICLDGTPAILEANYMGQSIWFPQITHGETIFEENTTKILKMIGKRGGA